MRSWWSGPEPGPVGAEGGGGGLGVEAGLTFGGDIIETGSGSYRLAHTKARQPVAAGA